MGNCTGGPWAKRARSRSRGQPVADPCRPYRAPHEKFQIPGANAPGYFMAPLRGSGGRARPKIRHLRCLGTSASHIPESRSESGHYSRTVDKKRAHGRAPLRRILCFWGERASAGKDGAGGETRTPTGRSPLRPERSASANSTTPAIG